MPYTSNKFLTILVILCGLTKPVIAQNLLATYQLALQNDPLIKASHANIEIAVESKDQNLSSDSPQSLIRQELIEWLQPPKYLR